MRKNTKWLGLCGLTLFILGLAGTAAAQKLTVKGLIVGRDGANVIVKGETGNVTIALDDSTKVQAIKGKLGFRKDQMNMTALVPGLPVEVEATASGGQYIANTIKFKADDLKTAHQIQAGITPTQQSLQATEQQVQANQQKLKGQEQQIEANQQKIQANQQKIQANQQNIQQVQGEQAALGKRFGELSDYDVKGTATVYFPVNSTTLSASEKQQLKVLAASARDIKGYLVQVAGYTDSSGNAALNQKLSERRAEAVINYLQQSCGVPLYRVLAPAGMGTSNPVATNETRQGMAENRRVVVKVLVNRGLSG